MATVTFRGKQFGLNHAIKIKKSFRKMQDFAKIMQNANNAELHATQRRLERLEANYPAKIKELKQQIKDAEDADDKAELQRQLDIAETKQQIQQLSEVGAQTDDASEFIDVATAGIIKTLELSESDADEFRSSFDDPEQLGNCLSYIDFKLGGGTDAEFDKLVKQHQQELKAKSVSGDVEANLTK